VSLKPPTGAGSTTGLTFLQGPTGATGPQGIQGVPGTAMGVLGVDVWASQSSPETVTDWGTIINALVAAGNKRLLFREEAFPFTTALNFGGVKGVVLEGVAGVNWIDSTAGTDVARLLWKGTGAGRAIDCRSADGLVFQDLFIDYDSGSFTGTLIDLGTLGGANPPSAYVIFERCRIGPSSLRTASCLIKTNDAVMPVFRDCGFRGAASAIRGYETAGTIAGNDMLIDGCVFSGCVVFLMNVGINWRVTNTTFEYTDTATTFAVDSDITYAGSQASGLWMENVTPVNFDMQGVGAVVLEGIGFSRSISGSGATALIDLGTTDKNYVRITGCEFTASDDTGLKAIANLAGGHNNIQVYGNKKGGQLEVRTLAGVERLQAGGAAADYKPSLALSAGQPSTSVTTGLVGNCVAGYVYLINQSGGAMNTGALLDLTIPAASQVPGQDTFTGGQIRTLCVQLTPADDLGNTISGAATDAVGGYVKASVTTGFSIGTRVAVPNNDRVGWFYRIVSL
jgi:hypothetical protein